MTNKTIIGFGFGIPDLNADCDHNQPAQQVFPFGFGAKKDRGTGFFGFGRAKNGTRAKVGGFQNPGTCLQAFLSFFPPPGLLAPLFRAVFDSRSSFVCFETVGSFSNDDGDGSETVKTAIGLLRKTTGLHVHHAFLYISQPSLRDYDVKMPNFTFYERRKQATTKFFLSLNLNAVSKKSTLEKFAFFRHFHRIRIKAKKFEKTPVHFKSDVFAAVAVVDAKIPQYGNACYAGQITTARQKNQALTLFRPGGRGRGGF